VALRGRTEPLSRLRKVIAQRMVESLHVSAQLTTVVEADVTAIARLRDQARQDFEAREGVKLSFLPFFALATLEALKVHPKLNAALNTEAGQIIYHDAEHLGIAVDTEAGLMVPVIRDVDKKNLLDLSKELEELAKKARERKLSAEEMKGGTFTISNQGGIGGAHFTPIVNKPEVAILGLGRGAMAAVVREKSIEPRMILPIALSYDHRVIDGGAAARFVVDLVKAFEEFKEETVQI
jgi:pyruvate/2-oxoglutarate dehydrogenase complex dihydrolipoamide acyltransferase (E2) component